MYINIYGKIIVTNIYSDKGVILNSYSFSLVSENKVLKYWNKISPHKTTSLDKIPSRLDNDGASIIANPLSHVIICHKYRVLSQKILKLIELFLFLKKIDKTSVGNYRPVSILSIVSKIFERVVYDQIKSYFKEKCLLYEFLSTDI